MLSAPQYDIDGLTGSIRLVSPAPPPPSATGQDAIINRIGAMLTGHPAVSSSAQAQGRSPLEALQDEVSRMQQELYDLCVCNTSTIIPDAAGSADAPAVGSGISAVDYSIETLCRLAEKKWTAAAFQVVRRRLSGAGTTAADVEAALREMSQDLQVQLSRTQRSLEGERQAAIAAAKGHTEEVLRLEAHHSAALLDMDRRHGHVVAHLQAVITKQQREATEHATQLWQSIMLNFATKLSSHRGSDLTRGQVMEALREALLDEQDKIESFGDVGEEAEAEPEAPPPDADVHAEWTGHSAEDFEHLRRALQGVKADLGVGLAGQRMAMRTKTLEWETHLRGVIEKYERNAPNAKAAAEAAHARVEKENQFLRGQVARLEQDIAARSLQAQAVVHVRNSASQTITTLRRGEVDGQGPLPTLVPSRPRSPAPSSRHEGSTFSTAAVQTEGDALSSAICLRCGGLAAAAGGSDGAVAPVLSPTSTTPSAPAMATDVADGLPSPTNNAPTPRPPAADILTGTPTAIAAHSVTVAVNIPLVFSTSTQTSCPASAHRGAAATHPSTTPAAPASISEQATPAHGEGLAETIRRHGSAPATSSSISPIATPVDLAAAGIADSRDVFSSEPFAETLRPKRSSPYQAESPARHVSAASPLPAVDAPTTPVGSTSPTQTPHKIPKGPVLPRPQPNRAQYRTGTDIFDEKVAGGAGGSSVEGVVHGGEPSLGNSSEIPSGDSVTTAGNGSAGETAPATSAPDIDIPLAGPVNAVPMPLVGPRALPSALIVNGSTSPVTPTSPAPAQPATPLPSAVGGPLTKVAPSGETGLPAPQPPAPAADTASGLPPGPHEGPLPAPPARDDADERRRAFQAQLIMELRTARTVADGKGGQGSNAAAGPSAVSPPMVESPLSAAQRALLVPDARDWAVVTDNGLYPHEVTGASPRPRALADVLPRLACEQHFQRTLCRTAALLDYGAAMPGGRLPTANTKRIRAFVSRRAVEEAAAPILPARRVAVCAMLHYILRHCERLCAGAACRGSRFYVDSIASLAAKLVQMAAARGLPSRLEDVPLAEVLAAVAAPESGAPVRPTDLQPIFNAIAELLSLSHHLHVTEAGNDTASTIAVDVHATGGHGTLSARAPIAVTNRSVAAHVDRPHSARFIRHLIAASDVQRRFQLN